MSELMRPIPFDKLVKWSLREYEEQKSVFGIKKDKFYRNKSGTNLVLFGDNLISPIVPAAVPNSQLSKNIIASYLAGSRFVELKTVQKMDGEDLRKCIARPCINAEDEGYNVEWSTELTVQEAFVEYVKAYIAIHVLAKEFEISDVRDFAFNMSVGYDLEGIKTEKIDNYIEGLKYAANTEIWKESITFLKENLHLFKKVTAEDIDKISPNVCRSICLSTLHGCPPAEIERIARYLISEKKVHTFIKCNPTLLGYEFARNILNEMGYEYITFDDHHFKNDLQWNDAVVMINRLIDFAKENEVEFGVKLTNTFPVQIANNELPGNEMYMSGRSLYPLTISLANRISKEFKGKLPISFSGGADYFNIKEIFNTGIQPITVATTILKPGGYERLKQLAETVEPLLTGPFHGINVEALDYLARNVIYDKNHLKETRPVKSRKTTSLLPLYDCAKAPCKDGGCPIHQQIPEYLKMVSEGKFKEAFEIIVNDNSSPAVLGVICDHQCQHKCTRLDYEESLRIRDAKKKAVLNAMDIYLEEKTPANVITKKIFVVIGAGPGGVSTAYFLRRNGMDVTVLEKRGKPYGIVQYVIPEFRISHEMINRDYQLAVNAGVKFVFNVNENYNVDELKKEYDFVILATGAWKKAASPVKEGEEYLRDSLEFLESAKNSNLNLSLGKNVAIIGGGSVAMDCARTALRCPGVEKVSIVYRRTRDFMPAEPEEKEVALQDGVVFQELYSPVSYDGKTFVCEAMELSDRDASGRRGVKGTGKFESFEFDTVVNATGARVDSSLFEANGLKLTERGYAALNQFNETSKENVYIAGDCKAGAATIVKAVADAKIISKNILDKCGLTNDFKKFDIPQDDSTLYERKGILEHGTEAKEDGKRCLACDKICEICVDVCPNRANVLIKLTGGSEIFSQKHQIVHIDGMCNECGNCGIFCPHTGNPYKDKITVFWTEHDFIDSTNKGFLRIGENKFKVRKEDGSIIEHTLGDGQISDEMNVYLNTVLKNYSYYMLEF